jgi:ribosomal protein S27AE
MSLFKRKSKQVALAPCPQCGQLLASDALECGMCGLDLREPYVRPVAAGREPEPPAAAG